MKALPQPGRCSCVRRAPSSRYALLFRLSLIPLPAPLWPDKWLGSIAAYGPTFEEEEERREYGAAGLYEYYPTDMLALGGQAVLGFGEQANRLRVGPYVRWGITQKWALLAEVDYTRFWDIHAGARTGDQITAFLQLHYTHTEWLVSSVTGNFVYSDLFANGETNHFSGRFTLSARLSRNLTVGATISFGDSRRHLQEG